MRIAIICGRFMDIASVMGRQERAVASTVASRARFSEWVPIHSLGTLSEGRQATAQPPPRFLERLLVDYACRRKDGDPLLEIADLLNNSLVILIGFEDFFHLYNRRGKIFALFVEES